MSHDLPDSSPVSPPPLVSLGLVLVDLLGVIDQGVYLAQVDCGRRVVLQELVAHILHLLVEVNHPIEV